MVSTAGMHKILELWKELCLIEMQCHYSKLDYLRAQLDPPYKLHGCHMTAKQANKLIRKIKQSFTLLKWTECVPYCTFVCCSLIRRGCRQR